MRPSKVCGVISVFSLAVIAVCTVTAVAASCGLRFNTSSSMPRGLWLEWKAPGAPYQVGDVVVTCPPLKGWQQRYVSSGNCATGLEPMLKPIAAVEGDMVTTSPDGVAVNGELIANSAPLNLDGRGRLMQPFPEGTYRVMSGQVWFVVTLWYSFDSRYFGPVSTDDIEGHAEPVWVR